MISAGFKILHWWPRHFFRQPTIRKLFLPALFSLQSVGPPQSPRGSQVRHASRYPPGTSLDDRQWAARYQPLWRRLQSVQRSHHGYPRPRSPQYCCWRKYRFQNRDKIGSLIRPYHPSQILPIDAKSGFLLVDKHTLGAHCLTAR